MNKINFKNVDKRGIVWLILAVLYVLYNIFVIKHGFMIVNTTATILLFATGIYYIIKNEQDNR